MLPRRPRRSPPPRPAPALRRRRAGAARAGTRAVSIPTHIRSQPSRRSQPNIAAVEVDTPLVAEADSTERVIHFRLGKTREARTVRVGRDLLLDVDRQSQIAGLWLLNVPPFPDGMARLDEL